jgi:hypothetical protein
VRTCTLAGLGRRDRRRHTLAALIARLDRELCPCCREELEAELDGSAVPARHALMCRDEREVTVTLHVTLAKALEAAADAASSTEHPRSPEEVVDLDTGSGRAVYLRAALGGSTAGGGAEAL